jgi:hypothetical protein
VCDLLESEHRPDVDVEQPTDPPAAAEFGTAVPNFGSWAEPARGRLTAPGRRTDDGRACVLVVVNEADGLWSFRGPVESGVRVTRDIVVALADAILRRAR